MFKGARPHKSTAEKVFEMTEILAVFRSRTQAIECRAKLKGAGIPASIVATPAELKAGCGYSVAFPAAMQRAAKNAISRRGYSAFYGYYTPPARRTGY